MRRIRGITYLVVMIGTGVTLVLGGGLLYQYSVASAQQINNSCPYGTPCAYAEPTPLGLWLADAGWIFLVAGVASVPWLYLTAFRRRETA